MPARLSLDAEGGGHRDGERHQADASQQVPVSGPRWRFLCDTYSVSSCASRFQTVEKVGAHQSAPADVPSVGLGDSVSAGAGPALQVLHRLRGLRSVIYGAHLSRAHARVLPVRIPFSRNREPVDARFPMTRGSLDFQMALDYGLRFRVGDADSYYFGAVHVDALRLESLQGPARRARGARSAAAEQIAVLLVSNERKGR